MAHLIATFAVTAAPWAAAQPPPPGAPTFATMPVTTANVDAVYTYSIIVSDPDLADVITITAPVHPGWLTFTDNGNRTATLTGTPTAADIGNQDVTLIAGDGVTTTAQIFTIAVGPSQVPIGVPDNYSTPQDRPLDVKAGDGVLANDINPAGGPKDKDFIATLVTTTSHGTLTLEQNGAFKYAPAQGYVGSDTFAYTAGNGVATSAPVTVTIAVTDVNDAPVAGDDAYTTGEDTQLTVDAASGVLANDTDADVGTTLTATLVDDVDHGTLALQPNGAFIYAPNPNSSGPDRFTYRANDGTTASNTATVTISVSSGNDAPVAANDNYSAQAAVALNVSAANGVLHNDTDVDGDPLTAVLVTNVASGLLQLNADGSFTYTANAGFGGNDSFTYQPNDGTALGNPATVTIAVTVNGPPVATADSYTTREDTALTVNAANGVLGNDTDPDGDPLTAALVTNVARGTLTLNANGSFTYTPAAGDNGAVSFTYHASDGEHTSGDATVTINVTAVNDPPTAVADSYKTSEDTPMTVGAADGVLANDTDPDEGTTLTAVLGRNVASGSLTLSTNGGFTFTPAPNFNGTASFTYQARDGEASSAAVTVTITVSPVNDAPFITSSPAMSVNEGVTYRYTLTATDPEGDPLVFGATALPAWLKFTPPATIAGTPAQTDVGVHRVTLTVSDGAAAATVQTFQITVVDVDNAPVIAPIAEQTVTEGAPVSINLAPSVTDADTPAASLVFAATGGLPTGVTLSPAGMLTGTPALGQGGRSFDVAFTVADAASTVPGRVRLTVLRAGRTDLAVSVAAAPNPVALGAPATWTVTIANLAPTVDVPSFTLTATFNGEVPFRFDAPATPGCTAAPSGNETTITCTLGPLAGGATTTVPLTGSGGFAGDVFANVAVAVNGPVPIDETVANDHATASLSLAQRVAATPAQEISNLAARAAAAGDLNADGYDDLAIATGSSQGTIVLLTGVDPANPDKRALATTPIVLGGEATGNAVAIADLDRDNDLDIVVAAGGGAPNRVFLNNAGSFIASTVANAPQGSRAVAIGDVNGDSFPDLVFAGPQGVTLLLNTGSGGVFGGPASIATGDAQDVVLADLFGDPLPELVIANTAGDAAVYRNTGGKFALEKTIATGAAAAVRTADFNGDGRYDLVFGRNVAAAGEPFPTNLVWLNTSTTSGDFFLSDRLGAAATTSVAVADFDLDGDADVLAVNRDSQQIYANAGAGSGTFTLQPEQLQRTAALMAVTGKFSVDDRVDAAIVANGGVAVFYNDGAGNLGQGDVTGPTIALSGPPSITLTVGDPYTDAGATATDTLDGDVTSRIKVTNTVDPAVVGNYAVTYNATDKSGNAATPVVRNVNVQTRAAEGGGGGAADLASLAALLAAWLARRRLSGRRALRGA